jgi:hypothetical protein
MDGYSRYVQIKARKTSCFQVFVAASGQKGYVSSTILPQKKLCNPLRDFILAVAVPRAATTKDMDQMASKQRAEVSLGSGHTCFSDAGKGEIYFV